MKLFCPLALLSLLLAGGCCWNADSCTEVWAVRDGGVDAPVDVGEGTDAVGDAWGDTTEGGEAGADVLVDTMPLPDCTGDLECSTKSEDEPICDKAAPNGGMCRACMNDGECDGRPDGKRSCENSRCVECKTNAQCTKEERPVCGAGNLCRACVQDSECTTGPGICLESEGRCAKDSEVQYVDARSGCEGSAGSSIGGTIDKPFCAPQLAVDVAISRNRRVIILKDNDVLEPVKIALSTNERLFLIGKGAKEPPATIKAGVAPGIDLMSGIAFVRGVTIKSGFNQGVRATGLAAELNMNRCVVQENSKGGVLLTAGASFEITNTLVTGNGAKDSFWGGVNVEAGGVQPKKSILRHVTIAGNQDLPALACDVPITATGLLSYGGAATSIFAACKVVSCCENAPFTSAYKLQSTAPSLCLNRVPLGATKDLIDVFGQLRANPGDCGADELDN